MLSLATLESENKTVELIWGSAPNPGIFEDMIQINRPGQWGDISYRPRSCHDHRRSRLCRETTLTQLGGTLNTAF